VGPLRSRRLLALAGDDRLVAQLRIGNETAYEVAFERHGPGILSFCRHMLGSHEEAEDVVQHTFAAAHRALLGEEREIALKPWLYAIARNRCISLLRVRREQPLDSHEPSTIGLAEEVERRAELRELLADLADLPADQRAALLLAEVADLSHAEAGEVLDCEAARVKALVYRARQGLLERRDARTAPCEEIREQLASLRGGALRRGELRHHLRVCAGCREFRDQVKQQRAMLGVALPAVPSLGLKASVVGAAGVGGGSAGGAALTKLAIVGVLAGGGAAAGDAVIHRDPPARDLAPPAHTAAPRPAADVPAVPGAVPRGAGRAPGEPADRARRPRAETGAEGVRARPETATGRPATAPVPGRGRPAEPGAAGRDRAAAPKAVKARGRGPVAEQQAHPVRRGPPAERGRTRDPEGRHSPPAEADGEDL